MCSNSLAVVTGQSQLPESLLDHLQGGWQGSLNDGRYSDSVDQLALRIVDGTSADPATLNQLRTLGMMGVDLEYLKRFEEIASDEMDDSEVRSKRAVLREVHKDQKRAKRKFIGQLGNDKSEDGANPFERASFKGMLVAELEKNRGIVNEKFLTSAKRSLVLDVRRGADRTAGYVREQDLVRELERLEINDPDSFIWCSSTETTKHALDTVVRKVTKDGKEQFEFTTCNRGKGAVIVEGPVKNQAQALSSYWPDSKVLAKEWSRQTFSGMALDHDAYEHAMHPNKETNPNYRPQSLQKTGNCAAHSMLAALNFLIQGPEDGSKYKAIKGTMMASLGLPPRVRPVVAEPVEVTITRREIEKLKGQSDETYIGFLADKFSGANKVPNAVTIGAFRTLPETVKAKLKASGFEWAKRYI